MEMGKGKRGLMAKRNDFFLDLCVCVCVCVRNWKIDYASNRLAYS